MMPLKFISKTHTPAYKPFHVVDRALSCACAITLTDNSNQSPIFIACCSMKIP